MSSFPLVVKNLERKIRISSSDEQFSFSFYLQNLWANFWHVPSCIKFSLASVPLLEAIFASPFENTDRRTRFSFVFQLTTSARTWISTFSEFSSSLRISAPWDKIPAALSFFDADRTIASSANRWEKIEDFRFNKKHFVDDPRSFILSNEPVVKDHRNSPFPTWVRRGSNSKWDCCQFRRDLGEELIKRRSFELWSWFRFFLWAPWNGKREFS